MKTTILAESRPFYQIKHGEKQHFAPFMPRLAAHAGISRRAIFIFP
nr:hypothetical protein [uncultured Janthinobacterium sp.]